MFTDCMWGWGSSSPASVGFLLWAGKRALGAIMACAPSNGNGRLFMSIAADAMANSAWAAVKSVLIVPNISSRFASRAVVVM